VFQVDVAGRDEGVNAGPLGRLERPGGSFHVQRAGAGQGGNRNPGELAAHCGNGLEIAVGGNGKPRFDHVDSQFHQFVRHAQLLGNCHAAAGRLLAIAQGSVEECKPGCS